MNAVALRSYTDGFSRWDSPDRTGRSELQMMGGNVNILIYIYIYMYCTYIYITIYNIVYKVYTACW